MKNEEIKLKTACKLNFILKIVKYVVIGMFFSAAVLSCLMIIDNGGNFTTALMRLLGAGILATVLGGLFYLVYRYIIARLIRYAIVLPRYKLILVRVDNDSKNN